MSVPGEKDGIYQTNGLEHDEFGPPGLDGDRSTRR